MYTQQTSLPIQASVTSASRLVQIGLAAFLGLFVLGIAGFSHIEAIHNASHDVRHSLAFPCH
ncbi:CbtB domain-containing protein [Microvirga tunisiensis]|uniref:Cobalt transporter subunit CbtB n=1 Tax=Microvirga tunisiensis TaxID=2108360 RepID=A0A5N7MP67_9HYPH|nr:CbtB-domain containing protein [Microvirga tunisiensis]MPR10237.1 cobalt transporter subunit CbtB [Microvirga tunisiensis]MPR28440.1 cobalt transporter subunit CbtB [Microvirga tunisiensis]